MMSASKYLWVILGGALLATAMACSDDGGSENDNANDNNNQPPASLQLQEIRFNQNDRIEVRNGSTETIDASSHWFCANRVYRQLSTMTIESGSLSLSPGATVILSGLDLANASDLGLYETDSFASADAIIDYVKWGQSSANDRESVAVTAGIWTVGDSVDVSAIQPGQSIEYDGEGDASSDWAIQANPTLADQTGVTPSVEVADQTLTVVNQVSVTRAVSDGPGWIVVHEDNGSGDIGGVIGFAALNDGVNEDVLVVLDRFAVDSERLFAMLHTDVGIVGTFEFPGGDGPVSDENGVIAPPFIVTVPKAIVPQVTASNYTAALTTEVEITEAVSVGPGWIVFHEDDGTGGIGNIIGQGPLQDGINTNPIGSLDRRLIDGETIYAMLYTDAGTIGTFEFPGADNPVSNDSGIIAPSFVVTVPTGTPDIRLRFDGDVPSYQVSIEPSTFASDIDSNLDPQITLRPTWRYEIINVVPDDHPWEIIDSSGNVLLSQATAGSLESDTDIDWEDNGAGRSLFTVDEDLRNAATRYRCSIHTGSMIGPLVYN